MDIKEITSETRDAGSIIADLKKKSVQVPEWAELEKEYEPSKHPVVTDTLYRD